MEPTSNTVHFVLPAGDLSPPTYDQGGTSPRRLPGWAKLFGVATVLAITPLSSNLQLNEPNAELYRSQVVSVFTERKQRRRKITLAEAWIIAGNIYRQAHKQRIAQRERDAEAFLFWQPEE